MKSYNVPEPNLMTQLAPDQFITLRQQVEVTRSYYEDQLWGAVHIYTSDDACQFFAQKIAECDDIINDIDQLEPRPDIA